MRQHVDELKIVDVSALPVGTFFRAIGNHGSQPLLGVVVQLNDDNRGAFALEGENAYNIVRIANLRGYTCQVASNRYIQLADAQSTAADRYNAGQLAVTDDGAYIIGQHGPEWQRNNAYVNVATWVTRLALAEFADPTCFDQWSLIGVDEFGNSATIFSGQRIGQ